MKALIESGVPVTINSDDPTFFATTLTDEFVHVYNSGVPLSSIFEVIRNGFIYSFLSIGEMEEYLRRVDLEWERLTGQGYSRVS